MKQRLTRLVLSWAVLTCACGSDIISASMQNQNLDTRAVTIRNNSGNHLITAEVADSITERRIGLMNRQSLAEDAGMLFVFESDVDDGFWMKDTYVSLDILFINADKRIIYIAENTTVLSEEPITSTSSYRYAMEVSAGYCAAHGVNVGDAVEF